MKYTVLALTALGLCLAGPAWSATVVESTSGGGQAQKVLLQGKQVRIDSGNGAGYMLMNLADKKIFAVNSEQKQVIDLSNRPEGPQDAAGGPPAEDLPKVDTQLVNKGAGPEIAGYATVHYQVTANGEVCSDEYLSAEVLKIEGILTFIHAMQEMNPKKNAPMPFMKANPCLQAGIELMDQFEKLGMSMRSVSSDGKVQHEITKIQTAVEAPAGSFEVPKDYSVNTPQDMMQKMMQEMSERMKNMPEEERQRMMEMQKRMQGGPAGGE